MPRPLLIADRNDNRIIVVTQGRKTIWTATGLHQPDDAFFTPGGRTVITNEEFDETISDDWNHRVILVDRKTKRIVWQYGHTGVTGSGFDYLNKPDGMDLAPPAVASWLLAHATAR